MPLVWRKAASWDRSESVSVGDRTVVPSGSRRARAWRGGLRSRSRWLDTAAVSLAVSVTLSVLPRFGAEAAKGAIEDALVHGELWPQVALECSMIALGVVATFAASTIVARVMVAIATGTLGAVDREVGRRLGAAAIRPSFVALTLLGLVAVVLVATSLESLIAASSRAVDTSAEGVQLLWSAWASRVALLASVVLGLVGVLELGLARTSIVRALFQTVDDARRDARRRS